MSTTSTAALAAGALLVGGIAGAALTPAPAPTATDAAAAVAVLDAFVAAHPDPAPTPTASPSPSDIPTTVGPTSPSAPVVTSSAPSPNITTPSSTPSVSVGPLAWKPPVLTSPATITPTDEVGKVTLAAGRDYVIRLPADRAWKNTRGLWVEGGRHVVIIGGLVDVGTGYACGSVSAGCPASLRVKRGAYFTGQTGTVHVEGVAFTSSTGTLSEGINVSAPLARLQLLNVALRATVTGTQATNHGDCLQSWSGPVSLRVDGFTCTTAYQGAFLNAHDTSTASVVADDWELRNVEIVGTIGAKYLLWVVAPPASVKTTAVYTSGGLGNWDAANDWPNVTRGRAPAPGFATTAGPGYVSPGYTS